MAVPVVGKPAQRRATCLGGLQDALDPDRTGAGRRRLRTQTA